jgi:hypothetical protein
MTRRCGSVVGGVFMTSVAAVLLTVPAARAQVNRIQSRSPSFQLAPGAALAALARQPVGGLLGRSRTIRLRLHVVQ